MPGQGSATGASSRADQARLRALAKANDVRVARAQLKRGLAGHRVDLASVLDDPPPCVQTATVSELLLALPGIGPSKSRRLLTSCRIAETKTVASLSDRQRDQLLRLLHPE